MDPRLVNFNGVAEVFGPKGSLCYSMGFFTSNGIRTFDYRDGKDYGIAEITFDNETATTGTVKCLGDDTVMRTDTFHRIDLTSAECADSKTGVGGGTPPPGQCPEAATCTDPK